MEKKNFFLCIYIYTYIFHMAFTFILKRMVNNNNNNSYKNNYNNNNNKNKKNRIIIKLEIF